MEIDEDKIDDAVLALLYLTLGEDGRAWKGFDWGAMDRLHARGMLGNPRSPAKSVLLTEDGRVRSKDLFARLFAKSD